MVTSAGTCSLKRLSPCVVSTVESENEVSNRSFSVLTNINALGILCYVRARGSIVSVLVFVG